MLHGQQIALVRRFGRQFGKIGQNDGKPLRNPLRPPGKFRHRNLAEPVLFAGNAVGRHLVRAVVGPAFPVEFDDVGPSAVEHRQHFIQDLIDRVLGPLGVQQREQRMRNAGETVEQVVDPGAVPVGDSRLFEFRLLHITGHDIPSVGRRLAVDHFPLKPQPPPVGGDHRNGTLERMGIPQQTIFRAGYFSVSLRDQAFYLVESNLRSGIPKQILQKIGHVKYPPRHIRFPPTGPGIFQYCPQYLFFFHQ